jgi:hypothetical protein
MSTVHGLAASLSPKGWGLVALAVLGLLTGRRHRSRGHRRYWAKRRVRRPVIRRERRGFTTDQRAQIFAKANGCCCWCWWTKGRVVPVHYETDCHWVDGCDFDFEADHYYPCSKGGPTTVDNGVASCRKHNRAKSDRDPAEFLAAGGR